MFSRIRSLGVSGVGGYEVSVEVNISSGLPAFDIVGLPDAAVKESRERVRAAIKNNGFKFPVSRMTVNLAPADKKMAGTVYDLPLLIGILTATEDLKRIPEDCAFIGELSLKGELRPVPGTLPMAMAAERAGIRTLFVPEENAPEAAFAPFFGKTKMRPARGGGMAGCRTGGDQNPFRPGRERSGSGLCRERFGDPGPRSAAAAEASSRRRRNHAC